MSGTATAGLPPLTRPARGDVIADARWPVVDGAPTEAVRAGGVDGLVALACYYASRRARPGLEPPGVKAPLDPDFVPLFWRAASSLGVPADDVAGAFVALAGRAPRERALVYQLCDGLAAGLHPAAGFLGFHAPAAAAALLAGGRAVHARLRALGPPGGAGGLAPAEAAALRGLRRALDAAGVYLDAYAAAGPAGGPRAAAAAAAAAAALAGRERERDDGDGDDEDEGDEEDGDGGAGRAGGEAADRGATGGGGGGGGVAAGGTRAGDAGAGAAAATVAAGAAAAAVATGAIGSTGAAGSAPQRPAAAAAALRMPPGVAAATAGMPPAAPAARPALVHTGGPPSGPPAGPSPLLLDGARPPGLLLGSGVPARVLADAWALGDEALFCAIAPAEWLACGWDRPRFEHAADGARAFVDKYNAASLWVSTEVLGAGGRAGGSPALRAATITRFVQVAHHLRRLNNFSGASSVVMGLRRDSVARLAASWGLVPPPAAARFAALADELSDREQYRAYKAAFAAVPPAAPAVPHVGAHTAELTAAEMNLPASVDLARGGPAGVSFKRVRELWRLAAPLVAAQAPARGYAATGAVAAVDDALAAALARTLALYVVPGEEERDAALERLAARSAEAEPGRPAALAPAAAAAAVGALVADAQRERAAAAAGDGAGGAAAGRPQGGAPAPAPAPAPQPAPTPAARAAPAPQQQPSPDEEYDDDEEGSYYEEEEGEEEEPAPAAPAPARGAYAVARRQ